MKIKSPVLFGLMILVGLLIWLLSPYFTGEQEPWDAEDSYYFVTLFIAGTTAGFLRPQKFWLWPIAIYIGQFSYGFFQILIDIFLRPGGGANLFFPIGMILLVVYSIISFAGSMIGARLRKLLRIKDSCDNT